MKKRSKGAWLIHHTKKLQEFQNIPAFEDIETSGRCGQFLSGLAASDEQSTIPVDKVNAIAQIQGIKKLELESILKKLESENLVDLSADGSVSVLGISTSTVLEHTANIYESYDPNSFQDAAIHLTDKLSEIPAGEKIIKEEIGDLYKLADSETNSLFAKSEDIGLIDYEVIDEQSGKLYFNGNLFRNKDHQKAASVLNSLSETESKLITEIEDLLQKEGCISLQFATQILGQNLLDKLQAIAFYDINEVSNSNESVSFLTKPSSFSKFGNPFEEDALDLAKAFVAALTYGMKNSSSGRGRIQLLEVLLSKLIRGYKVGPATAIGEDYRLLEYKRVIELEPSSYGRYYMRLLKKDIGIIAMEVLKQGGVAEQAVLNPKDIATSSITSYNGPEKTRVRTRKRQSINNKNDMIDILRTLRN